MKKFDMISLEEAGKMAIEEDCIVVDLRGRKDYDVSHIENAINLPNASLKEIEEFDKKDKIWILYCKRGERYCLGGNWADQSAAGGVYGCVQNNV